MLWAIAGHAVERAVPMVKVPHRLNDDIKKRVRSFFIVLV